MRAPIALVAASLCLFGVATAAQAAVITYKTSLSGAAEEPPVPSTGSGSATVTIDTVLRNYSIQIDFSDLVGGTTVAHIHGPTADPGTGLAGVMTMPGTFPGFPVGVFSGSYFGTFDTDDAASYTAGFLTANGNDVDAAEAAFFAALADGKAYVNVHSVFAPSGEIRGFLAPIPLPAGLVLSLTGLGALGALGIRRRAHRRA